MSGLFNIILDAPIARTPDRGSPTEPMLLDLLRHGRRDEALLRIASHTDEINLSDDGSTPLLVACTRGWGDVVEELVRCGVNVNVMSELGETPLMRAIKSGKIAPATIQTLLDAGAKDTLNSAAKENAFFAKWTALHFACNDEMNRFPVLVALLISYGADPKAVTVDGLSAADMCSNNAEFQKALQKSKDYLRTHTLAKNLDDTEEERGKSQDSLQVGSETVTSERPQRSSLLQYGRQLLGMSKKISTVIQDVPRPPVSPVNSDYYNTSTNNKA